MANEVQAEASSATIQSGSLSARDGVAGGRPDAAETFAHLYKMSATAGVATTDYAAISTMAIVALLLAVASVLALAWNYLLVIPAAGVFCAILAFKQIAGSNGTQTGKGIALGALLLSLGLGGTALAVESVRYAHRRVVEREVASFISNVGDEIKGEKYEAAYARFTDRFRNRVGKPAFLRNIDLLNQSEQGGRLESIRWNEEAMFVRQNPDTGADTVTAMTFFSFARLPQPERQVMVFTKEGDHWAIDDIPQIFPTERTPGKRNNPSPTAGP